MFIFLLYKYHTLPIEQLAPFTSPSLLLYASFFYFFSVNIIFILFPGLHPPGCISRVQIASVRLSPGRTYCILGVCAIPHRIVTYTPQVMSFLIVYNACSQPTATSILWSICISHFHPSYIYPFMQCGESVKIGWMCVVTGKQEREERKVKVKKQIQIFL